MQNSSECLNWSTLRTLWTYIWSIVRCLLPCRVVESIIIAMKIFSMTTLFEFLVSEGSLYAPRVLFYHHRQWERWPLNTVIVRNHCLAQKKCRKRSLCQPCSRKTLHQCPHSPSLLCQNRSVFEASHPYSLWREAVLMWIVWMVLCSVFTLGVRGGVASIYSVAGD